MTVNQQLQALAVLALPLAANATLLDFDSLNNNNLNTSAFAVYGGLTWVNASYMAPAAAGTINSGFGNGMVSLPKVAFNTTATPMQFSSATPFTFNSVFISGAWNNGLNVTVRGLLGGLITQQTSFVVGANAPSFEVFNWSGIDTVTISASGGSSAGFAQTGTQFVLDNLIINQPVPEPPTLAFLLSGLGVIARRAARKPRG